MTRSRGHVGSVLLLVALCVVVRAFGFAIYSGPDLNPDSQSYLEFAMQIVRADLSGYTGIRPPARRNWFSTRFEKARSPSV